MKAAEDNFGTYDMVEIGFFQRGENARSGLGHVLFGSTQWPTFQPLGQSS